MGNENIDISVVLVTYNQENFVEESLNSILKQKFNGTWEIIVADDCSEDSTFSKITKKCVSNSKLINAFSNKTNLGLAKNYEKAILRAKGKYIAYLEGDDYWTDDYKLQKQFDFLETNSSFILSFHDFIIVNVDGTIISKKNEKNFSLKRNRSRKEMVTGCLIHQNTILFRNVIYKFPKGFFKARNHDTFLIAYLSNWGEAAYVKCEPLHYRMQKNSLWSSLTMEKKVENALITYLWIFTIAEPHTYLVLLSKLVSKLKSFILIKLKWVQL